MQVAQLINIYQLAIILGRSVQTIRNDMCRNPAAVPPRIIIPGTRLCRWSQENIDIWIRKNSQAVEPVLTQSENQRKRGRPHKTLNNY